MWSRRIVCDARSLIVIALCLACFGQNFEAEARKESSTQRANSLTQEALSLILEGYSDSVDRNATQSFLQVGADQNSKIRNRQPFSDSLAILCPH